MSHSAPSPDSHPAKRHRPSSPDKDSPTSGPSAAEPTSPTITDPQDGAANAAAHSSKVGQSSSFRNVSACNRCRLRKNRCDQKLPSCASCEKAGVACVGYDPITKREIPRSYVFYLETRVEQLEALLRANNISFPAARSLEHCSRPGEGTSIRSPTEAGQPSSADANDAEPRGHNHSGSRPHKQSKTPGMVGNSGEASARYLGSTNGVSFARVVFAAVQSSVSDHRSTSDRAGVKPYKAIAGNSDDVTGTSMRDSFFGLHTKPTIQPAPFPNKELALKLVNLYFEHANPQIPVLHRVDFMQMFELAYAEEGRICGPKELYMLNMVFAIGGGIIMDGQATSKAGSDGKRSKQAQPEEYHASAIVHLEACLSSSGGGLEELQAVLLLANFALLRPVAPGLWYIVGVAVRLAVDLGLHYEDGKDIEFGLADGSNEVKTETTGAKSREAQIRERGRREYMRDFRRRLWWCTYSFDRLVSTCVGRPLGISDQVITTEFPSLLEDRYITHSGFAEPPLHQVEPTYKIVAYHYFRLRLLQSEILQVLQYQQSQMARATGQNLRNQYMHTQLPSPFLAKFESFRLWRIDIDKRLYEWKNSAPSKQDSGVLFSPEFLDLNYWQAIIMLYRQSLSVPAMFEGEYHTSKEVNSPSVYSMELREDEDRVYLKVAEAGQKILRLYRSLHVNGLVNYTYLATHHLFMAGISYLYAIWHSPIVRSRLTMDEVDFTILAATSVFTDLIEKCPPAEACRDAFNRTAKATLKMATSTGGFGQVLNRSKRPSKGSYDSRSEYFPRTDPMAINSRPQQRTSIDQGPPRSSSQYDVNLQDRNYQQKSPIVGHPPPINAAQFRMQVPGVKTENDGYSMPRQGPGPALSTGSGSPDLNTIDPVFINSPTGGPQVQSPRSTTSNPPNQALQQQNTPTSAGNMNFMRSPIAQFSQAAGSGPNTGPTGGTPLNFSDLQGMDFLQSLQNNGGIENGDGGNTDTQMDLGFGLGWEGLNHDFSNGQQLDLFDGFFFGGQQGGNGL